MNCTSSFVRNRIKRLTGLIYDSTAVSIFYCFIAASIAELASAIPASGGGMFLATIFVIDLNN